MRGGATEAGASAEVTISMEADTPPTSPMASGFSLQKFATKVRKSAGGTFRPMESFAPGDALGGCLEGGVPVVATAADQTKPKMIAPAGGAWGKVRQAVPLVNSVAKFVEAGKGEQAPKHTLRIGESGGWVHG
jgi:hypothetical protein